RNVTGVQTCALPKFTKSVSIYNFGCSDISLFIISSLGYSGSIDLVATTFQVPSKGTSKFLGIFTFSIDSSLYVVRLQDVISKISKNTIDINFNILFFIYITLW